MLYDGRLGAGATAMVHDMMDAIGGASKQSRLPLVPFNGMELRPRLAIGGLAMDFVVEGPHLFVVKEPLHEEEPVWQYVVRAGFSKLSYAPMRPAAFPEPPPAGMPRV
ncbi:MAG: hypothetical protein IH621_18065 [Krumholzibacteria bacterium]|nr:hypothetical protein [Candidatus Krumholzibacteria bacterium]